MSSSPPPSNFGSSSSPMRPSSETIRSERLRANPTARAYLVRNAGQDLLVTLQEARQWFQQGFTIRDPDTREPTDIGAVPIPSYADGRGTFVQAGDAENAARKALVADSKDKGEAKDVKGEASDKGRNGHTAVNGAHKKNGKNGGSGTGGMAV